MERIHMSENKNYYQELYAACNYIIDHIEAFKDYEIYSFVIYEMRPEKDQIRGGEGVALKLHNRLLAQFKFLIGEGENKRSQTDPKGTEIVPKIDYQLLKTIKLAKMLAITDHFINKYNMNLNYQMFKINVDKTVPMMDYLIEQIMSADEYNEFGRRREYLRCLGIKNIPESNEYFKILEMNCTIKGKSMNNEYQNALSSSVFAYYAGKLEGFIKSISQSDNSFTENFQSIHIESCFNAMLCVELCCKSILQYVIQGIIKNKKNRKKMESIKKLNEAICFCINIKMMEWDKAEKKTKLEERPEGNLFRFYFFFLRGIGCCRIQRILKNLMICRIITKNLLRELH